MATASEESIFRHIGFEQLSIGKLGNAGQNLWVSQRGELKLVNWFDLERGRRRELVNNDDHSPYDNSASILSDFLQISRFKLTAYRLTKLIGTYGLPALVCFNAMPN